MKLLVTRHTETNYNVLKLCNSDPSVDVHLTSKGVSQAEALAERLKDVPVDVLFISELPRTKQTAEIINKFHDKPLIVDSRINDNHTGFEGKPIQAWLEALAHSPNKWSAIFGNGESLEQTIQRVREFLDEVRDLSYQNILVVTHGFVTQAMYEILNQTSHEEAAKYQIPQGEYSTFEL